MGVLKTQLLCPHWRQAGLGKERWETHHSHPHPHPRPEPACCLFLEMISSPVSDAVTLQLMTGTRCGYAFQKQPQVQPGAKETNTNLVRDFLRVPTAESGSCEHHLPKKISLRAFRIGWCG